MTQLSNFWLRLLSSLLLAVGVFIQPSPASEEQHQDEEQKQEQVSAEEGEEAVAQYVEQEFLESMAYVDLFLDKDKPGCPVCSVS